MANQGFPPNEPPGVSLDPPSGFTDTWQRIVTDPRRFFESLSLEGGLQGPLGFAAICIAVGAVEFLIFGGGFRGFFGFLILGLARLFVGSAVILVVAQNLFDGRGDYEATFRAIAYAAAPAVLMGVPVVMYFAALYGAYLAILAIGRAQQIDPPRAFATALSSAIVGVVVTHAFGLWGVVLRSNPLIGP